MTLDLDVILAAHGAGDDSTVNASVCALALELARRIAGARVRAAFHKGEPSYAAAIRTATRANRIVVPLLTSEGYHYARLQRAVAEVDPTSLTYVVRPLGTDASFVTAFVESVTAQIIALGFDRDATHIIVVGHGTDLHPNSGAATTNVAGRLLESGFDRVRIAFLDEEPTVETVAGTIRRHEYLVVVPFLIGLGAHAAQDLPARVATAITKGPPRYHVAYVDPIAALPALAELIERVIRTAPPRTALSELDRIARAS